MNFSSSMRENIRMSWPCSSDVWSKNVYKILAVKPLRKWLLGRKRLIVWRLDYPDC
jgi:hypothetical protein